MPKEQIFFQKHNAFVGLELVPDAHRLCLMNLMLHGIEEGIESGDTLSPDGEALPKADLILTNPPFGTKKGGGRPNRVDFSITSDTSNKQLGFVEHVVRALKLGGRAAVVVPDNVLFEDNTGATTAHLDDGTCAIYTRSFACPQEFSMPRASKLTYYFSRVARLTRLILRQSGSMTCVTRWRLLARPGPSPSRNLLNSRRLSAAIRSAKPSAKIKARKVGFRCFTREEIKARNDNLDISWLRDTEAEAEEHLTEPEDIADAIIGHLKAALEEIETVSEKLEGDEANTAAGKP